ncbi:hypothetical protein D3C75_988710 [compost metagenome]
MPSGLAARFPIMTSSSPVRSNEIKTSELPSRALILVETISFSTLAIKFGRIDSETAGNNPIAIRVARPSLIATRSSRAEAISFRIFLAYFTKHTPASVGNIPLVVRSKSLIFNPSSKSAKVFEIAG